MYSWWRDKLPAVAGVVVLVVLAAGTGWGVWWLNHRGASSGHGGTVAQASHSSPVPTSSGPPRMDPPQLPEAAHHSDKAGIEATIQFMVDAINYGQVTGDSGPLRRIFDLDHCGFCKGMIEVVESNKEEHSYIRGRQYKIVSTQATYTYPAEDGALQGTTTATVEAPEGKRYSYEGKFLRDVGAQKRASFLYELVFNGTNWRIFRSQPAEDH